MRHKCLLTPLQVAGVDRVTRATTWNTVYLFGHRDAHTWSNFVTLDTEKGSLTLSDFHFLPTCVDRCDSPFPLMRYKWV